MDFTQWAGYAISAVFGGAGGIATSLAKFSSSIRDLDKRMLELGHRISILETKLGDHAKAHEESSHERAVAFEDIQKQVQALRETIDDGKKSSADYEASVQRALGAIEGTLNMIARNGCARACSPNSGGTPSPGRYQ